MSATARKLGPWNVTPVGLGCMPLSGMPHERLAMLDDRPGAISVIHQALDAGVQLLDTADIYAAYWNQFGHNERLVGEAFRTWNGSAEAKSKVVLATKGGITRGPLPDGEYWRRAATKDYFLRAAEASALRLGVEQIQLWQHHRLDPSMTFEEQFENTLILKERGLVQHIGVSNYNAEQLRRAVKIAGGAKDGGVVSIQNERSPRSRNEADVLEVCEEHSIAYLPWSPLGGVGRDNRFDTGGYEGLHAVAKAKGVSPYAVTIAWHLKTSSTIIPIPGATKASSILDCLVGMKIELSDAEMQEIENTLPANPPTHPELIDQPKYRN